MAKKFSGRAELLEATMERLLLVFESIAVELAPVDTGNLEASTETRVVAREAFVVGELAFVTPYAARVHELPEHSRGPLTQAKPGNQYGPAGPKYLERALRAMSREMPKLVAEEIFG